MALEINANVKSGCDCKGLSLQNAVLAYNALTNPGGWGTPNPAIGSVTATKGKLELSDGRIFDNINLGTSIWSLAQPWIYFSPTQLGMATDEALPDKKGFLTLTVTISGVDYTRILIIYPTCQIKCCITKLYKKVKIANNCCDDKAVDIFNDAVGRYNLLMEALKCCDFEAADAIYDELRKICEANQCETC